MSKLEGIEIVILSERHCYNERSVVEKLFQND